MRKKDKYGMRAAFIEFAKTDQSAGDILLIDEQNFDPTRFLLASTLMTSFRAFQMFESRGVPFSSVTPEFIVGFAERGEAALNEAALRIAQLRCSRLPRKRGSG